jgi:HEAT repeat protein
MSRPHIFCFLLLLLSVAPGWADETPHSAANKYGPRTIAGQTIDDYAAKLKDENRIVRLRAVRSLGAFGVAAGDALRESLDHSDAAVRYLAAENLGRIGGKPLEQAKARLTELAEDETSLAVRLAASYALCRAGLVDQHLPLLIETLRYPERGTACSAAELIGNIGPSAAAAIKTLEVVHEKNRPGTKGGDYHVGGATMNALRKLRPEQN